MTTGNNPLAGALYLIKGFSMLRLPELRKFVLIPLIINILLFASMSVLLYSSLNDLILELVAGLPEWLQWVDWLIWLLLGASIILFAYFTFTIVANIISAPFNGILSEAVEDYKLGKKESDNSLGSVFAEIIPALQDEWQKIFYSLSRSLPLLILLLIPGINLLASILWILFGTWVLSLQYLDYPLSNQKILLAQQRSLLKTKKWLILGFGGAVMLGTLLPILNFFIVPSAVVASTLIYIDHFREDVIGKEKLAVTS